MEKISVFLSDWQVLFREGIHFTLSGEEDMDVIGETTNNEDALDFIEKNPPRIAIVNANHSEFTGVDLTRRIQQNLPSVSVILIMDGDNEEQLFSAMKCGASAYATKDIDPDELVKLIRAVVQGIKPISEALLRPGIAPLVIEEFENFSLISKEVDNLLARLTSRESEILHSIADGNSIEQLSSTLSIKEETIRRHLGIILTKLVSNEHNQDVIEAAQKGLPSAISRTKRGKPAEYITKDEFEAFKENLKERFKSLTGELG
jgi:DNA-binding NarL/FixJ family response regulator